MKVTTCYTVRIRKQLEAVSGKSGGPCSFHARSVDGNLMHASSTHCLEALKYCVDVFLGEWAYLSTLPSSQKKGVLSRKRGADLLIHGTKDNEAKYPDFDKKFPYMPAYVRRSVIARGLGIVSSYVSNHKNWEELPPAERGSEPVLGLPDRYELTFYKQERDLSHLDRGIIRLKLYNGKTWDWYSFKVSAPDAKHISRMAKERKMLSPVVEKVHGGYRVRFSFEEECSLVQNENPLAWRILAVDLGINAPASWCVMESDGSVLERGVLHLNSDEDRLRHLIKRKCMYLEAGKKPKNIYRMVNAANRRLSIETAKGVIDIALLYEVDCIVVEYLDKSGKVKCGKYSERIHMWCVKDVQARVALQAHRNGLRVSRVCAWGTSKFAFDGSGPVVRDKKKQSLCTFRTGKRYNTDLSAAMNIGARFFLREYAKQEGCPELPAVPQRTYATLLATVSGFTA